MAFVSQEKRKLQTTTSNPLLGPGTYETPAYNSHIRDSYAPFCSTVSRRTRENARILPGPGSYQAKNNIGEPTLVTYANKTSIVIKVNSEGTGPFISKQRRFSSQPSSPEPGPGQYIFSQKQSKKFHQMIPKKKYVVQPIKKGPSILSKTQHLRQKRSKTDEVLRNMKQHLKSQKNEKGGVWARDKMKRFKYNTKDIEIGPGKYEHEMKQKRFKRRSQTVSFASNNVKSFLDTVMYKSVKETIVQDRKQKGYQVKQPGPGSYKVDPEYSNEAEKYKNHNFGSNIERFEEKQPKTCVPFYDEHHPKKSKKGDPAFLSQTKRWKTIESIEEEPGPGFYQPSKDHIGKVLKVNIGNFGSKERRSANSPKGNELIGPGYYNTRHVKTQESKQYGVFSSGVPRFQNKPKDGIFAEYDVYQKDISRRVQSEKKHIDNLEKIQSTKPPFESNIPRFEHYEGKVQKIPRKTLKQKELAIMTASYQERIKSIEKVREQVPKQKSTLGQSDRFAESKGGPGVGEYALRDRWLKRSYNTKYNPKLQ